jgi:hypothetical protein
MAHQYIIPALPVTKQTEQDIGRCVQNLCFDTIIRFVLCHDHKFLQHLTCLLAMGVAHQMPSCPHQAQMCGSQAPSAQCRHTQCKLHCAQNQGARHNTHCTQPFARFGHTCAVAANLVAHFLAIWFLIRAPHLDHKVRLEAVDVQITQESGRGPFAGRQDDIQRRASHNTRARA